MNIDRAGNDLEADWIECYQWLQRCGVVSPNDTVKSTDIAVTLMRIMMDGTIPLHLLYVLSDKQVDASRYREYTSSPNDSQFDCVTNLQLFNKLAMKHFGIREMELVDAVNIYTGRDFGRFILLLSRLSNSEYGRGSSIAGFPRENHQINAEHEYYNHFEDLAVKSDVFTRKRHEEIPYDRGFGEEKIYETLVQHRHHGAAEVPASRSGRDMCVMEIVESEKNYVESLQILVQGYKYQMMRALSPDETETIFRYIEDLYAIHKGLHSKLTIAIMPNRASMSPATRLHEVFIESKLQLLLYGRYCANLQIAQNLVADMVRTNAVKRSLLEKCQERSEKFRKFHLSDLLTLPMQRILKYHLLLQTLLKWTDDTHADVDGLRKAHEEMLDVAAFINDVKRDQEAIISIDKIQSGMTQIHLPTNKKLSDYGRRQKDGELKLQLETDQRPKQRHVFVFDKMILLAKRKSDQYEFKNAFYLPEKMPEKTEMQPRRQEKGFPFKVSVRNERSEPCSIIMFTKSEELRQQWMDAVRTAILNQYPVGARANGYVFEMFTFPNYEICKFCNKLLSGSFFQGYKCRKTGVISHKQCIPLPPSPGRMSQSRQNSEGSINTTDYFKEYNGHRQVDSRMNCDIKDSFDMTPFPFYPTHSVRDRTDFYISEPWYVGELERAEANKYLENKVPGTFLIRISKNRNRHGEYSLSVKDSEPKHMKIQRSIADNTYYIEELNKFQNLRELVEYYSQNCLNEFFRLEKNDLKLSFPIKLQTDSARLF